MLGGFSPFCVGEQSARVSLLVIPCVFLAFPCISCLSGVFAFLCVLGVSLALRILCLWEVVCLSPVGGLASRVFVEISRFCISRVCGVFSCFRVSFSRFRVYHVFA